MPRSFSYNALALRVKAAGESNREAWFLTAEEGIIRATVFGGPKSKLRARVAPFHGGALYAYHDPVRDSRKVNDFDVKAYRPGIRELYERAMAANAVAETILASHGGGGNWEEAFMLAGSALDGLESADASLCPALAVGFYWRWIGILGQKPDLSSCAACGKGTAREDTLWFSGREEAFFCGNCISRFRSDSLMPQDSGAFMRFDPGPRLWLGKIETASPAELPRISPDAASLEQARTLSLSILAGAIGRKLPTWDGV